MTEKTKSEEFAEAKATNEYLVAVRQGRVTATVEEATAQFSVLFAKYWKLSARLAAKFKASTEVAEIVKLNAEIFNVEPDGLRSRLVRAGAKKSGEGKKTIGRDRELAQKFLDRRAITPEAISNTELKRRIGREYGKKPGVDPDGRDKRSLEPEAAIKAINRGLRTLREENG